MTLAPAYPKYLRRRDSAVVAGVASGLAAHLRVNVAWIRIAFVVLSVLNGLGAGIYIGLWILSKSVTEGQPIPDRFNKLTSLTLVVAGLLLTLVGVFGVAAVSLWIGIPLLIIAVGSSLAWFAYDRFESKGASIAIIAGALLVISGLLLAAYHWEERTTFNAAVGTVLLTITGIAALIVPFGLRLWEKFSAQREAQLIADERAEIASRLHDSVLQTLALIQKRDRKSVV